MALKKTHDAVYSEKYTDRDGNEKTRYTNIGSLLTRDDGSMTLKLESLPIGFNGWINLYEPKPKDGEQRQERSRPQRAAASSDDLDDVPF